MNNLRVRRQKLEARGKRGCFFASSFYLLTSSLVFFSLIGCGPKYTYPADTVTHAVEQISRDESQLSVESQVAGKTLGAILYLKDLVDAGGQVPKEVHEKMGQVMQAVTRVALSTDLPLEFCVVVIRDRKQGNELLVTRSLDDTKKAYADALGVEESINRTLFGQGHYTLPLSGKPVFRLEEVHLENFLSDQIVQRIRFNFSKDAKNSAENPLVLADGSVSETPAGRRIFHFSMIGFKSKDPKENILGMLRIVSTVFQGYKFSDFDSIELRDYLNRQKLVVDQKMFLDFQNKKISEEELLSRFLTESQSIQEAFKLFGFSLPPGSKKDSQELSKPDETSLAGKS